jgi:hypothetical protein
MDMALSVKDCAERILGLLGRGERVNVLRVAEQVGERSLVTYQAIGWLAREGSIRYEQEGNQVYLSMPGSPQ